MVAEAFRQLRRYWWLVLYPIVLDLLALFVRFTQAGKPGETRLTLKFLLEPGLPSMLSLFDGAAGGVNLQGLPVGQVSVIAGLFFLLMIVVTAFAGAGFIGLLHEASNERPASFETFLAYARRFGLRLLGMRLITMLLTLTVFGGMLVLLRVVGIILGVALWAWLRVTYIYWEFTAVVEDLPLVEAFQRSREHFANRGPETAETIWVMVITNLAFGLLVNAAPSSLLLMPVAVAYGYFLTGLELALMGAYHRTGSWSVAA